MIEKMFEASIPAKTLEKRAQRIEEKIKTNVFTPTTHTNHSENSEKHTNQPLTDTTKGNAKNTTPGPGRAQKYVTPEPCKPLGITPPYGTRTQKFQNQF
jgi:hypothetical protein